MSDQTVVMSNLGRVPLMNDHCIKFIGVSSLDRLVSVWQERILMSHWDIALLRISINFLVSQFTTEVDFIK